jgi:hypothetical protein
MPDRGVDQRRWIFVRSNASTHLVGLPDAALNLCVGTGKRLIELPCSTQYCMSVQRSTFSMEACSSKRTDRG